MFTIVDSGSHPDDLQDEEERRSNHAILVSNTACRAYIVGCDEGNPFTLIVERETGPLISANPGPQSDSLGWWIQELAPPTTKLVSVSMSPSWTFGDYSATSIPNRTAVITATGNNPDENGIATGGEFEQHLRVLTAQPGTARVIRENRLLFVAGSMVENGEYVRHSGSVSCDGAETACLYAPFVFETRQDGYIFGTSVSTPQVASALASVLAVYTDTAGNELVKLAKACAVREPGLDGLGRADFTCMTVMDDNGQWRLADGGINGIISPARMASMRFPGTASVNGVFHKYDGETITLGTRSLGLFNFTPGVPVYMEEDLVGFFPVVTGNEEAHSLGIGYAAENGWFGRLALGRKDAFFGLGQRYGYEGSTAIDVDVGHRNAFARMSWQWSDSTLLIKEAEGVAFGLGMQQDVYHAGVLTINLSGGMSKFLGGSADTVFGPVAIGDSQWNREIAATTSVAISENSLLEVKTNYQQFGSIGDDFSALATYRITF